MPGSKGDLTARAEKWRYSLLLAGVLLSAIAAVAAHGAAIPVVPVAETVKRVSGGLIETTVDRTPLAAAQTPQGATRGILRAAYARFPPGSPETWTDEASLLEACRIPVHAIPGETSNLKVTLAEDLVRAEASLLGRARPRAGESQPNPIPDVANSSGVRCVA